jgi:hypothetical protein
VKKEFGIGKLAGRAAGLVREDLHGDLVIRILPSAFIAVPSQNEEPVNA